MCFCIDDMASSNHHSCLLHICWPIKGTNHEKIEKQSLLGDCKEWQK